MNDRHDIESIFKACLDAAVHRSIALSKSEDENIKIAITKIKSYIVIAILNFT